MEPKKKRARTSALKQRFARIREARTTDDGKACVDVAEDLFVDRFDVESRQWVRMALSCDKAGADEVIAELQIWKQEQDEKRKRLDQLDSLGVVDNVTELAPRGASA